MVEYTLKYTLMVKYVIITVQNKIQSCFNFTRTVKHKCIQLMWVFCVGFYKKIKKPKKEKKCYKILSADDNLQFRVTLIMAVVSQTPVRCSKSRLPVLSSSFFSNESFEYRCSRRRSWPRPWRSDPDPSELATEQNLACRPYAYI